MYIVDVRTETDTVDTVYSTNTSASNYLHQIQLDKILLFNALLFTGPIMRTKLIHHIYGTKFLCPWFRPLDMGFLRGCLFPPSS